ncbi:MAG: hypothetical protein LBH45_04560, partial [Campylobacteraceae bacterium]|nr:hypothetical protein [Campylobacteraceae bacterium]
MICFCSNLMKFIKLMFNFNNLRHRYSSCRFNKKIIVALFGFLMLTAYANAYNFDCNSIYAMDNQKVYKIKELIPTAFGGMYGENYEDTGIRFSYNDTLGNYSTIALGYSPGGTTLRLYGWALERWKVNANTSIRRPSYVSGSSTHTYINYSASGLGVHDSAGGGVNQLTGEIYLSSAYNDNLSGNYRLSIINPSTRAARTIAFSKGDISGPTLGKMISDLVIDVEGNVLVVSQDAASSSTVYLVRLDISEGKYYVLKNLTGDIPGKIGGAYAGMAFLDGYLYTYDSLDGNIYKVNIATGSSTLLGKTYMGFSDLSSCQMVSVIRGKVYDDADGDGVLSSEEKNADSITGITVQLYDGNYNLIDTQTTTSSGYNFVAGSHITGYYVRVKNPKKNGLIATQTWASGSSASNTVTNYCTDLINNDVTGSNQDRTCYGARADGIDSANDSITNANYYSKITMNNNNAAAYVDFAFTTFVDRSDAKASYGEALHSLGIKDILAQPVLYLGDGVSADNVSKISNNADGDDFDDGMFVMIDGAAVSLQDAVLIMGKPYTIQAVINGTLKNSGYLNAWIGTTSNGGLSNTFETKIADNLQNTSGDTIEFVYTPKVNPTTINTFIRARFSTVMGLTATDDVSASGYSLAINGEVEDYKVVIAGKQIRLNVKSIGDIGSFSFEFSNVYTTFPSTDTRTINTTIQDEFVSQPYDGTVHAINSANHDIVISEVSIPSNLGLVQSQTNCVDLSSSEPSANLSISFSGNDIIVPNSQITEQSNIVCNIVYGVQPTLEFRTNIINRVSTDDNFNISISDTSNVTLKSNQTTASESNALIDVFRVATGKYLFNQIMTEGSASGSGHYTKDIKCINLKNNTLVFEGDTLPFEIDAEYGDAIKCEIKNSAIIADFTTSDIKAEPLVQVAGNSSIITVSIKDDSGNVINSGGDDVVVFMNAANAMTLTNGMISETSTTANISAADNGDGTYEVYIHSIVASLANITFMVNGDLGTSNVTVTFTHSGNIDINGSNGKSYIKATPNTLQAGNISLISVYL